MPNARRRDRDWIGDISEGMRTKYETQHDLDNEMQIAGYLEKEWGCEFIKLDPIKWKVDYLIKSIKDKGKYAWCEIKRANINFGQYVFMISYKKIEAAKALYETSGQNFMLIFRCKDALCYHVWDFDKKYKFEYSGRTMTTRDSQDIEPVFRVDPNDCKIVEGFNA